MLFIEPRYRFLTYHSYGLECLFRPGSTLSGQCCQLVSKVVVRSQDPSPPPGRIPVLPLGTVADQRMNCFNANDLRVPPDKRGAAYEAGGNA